MGHQKRVFGFDLGTNSIGWAVIEEADGELPSRVVDMGARIFIKAVEDKTPTPKNFKRRQARLARRVIQRRARRRSRLQNYLVSLGLLPESVRDMPQSVCRSSSAVQVALRDVLPWPIACMRNTSSMPTFSPISLHRVGHATGSLRRSCVLACPVIRGHVPRCIWKGHSTTRAGDPPRACRWRGD